MDGLSDRSGRDGELASASPDSLPRAPIDDTRVPASRVRSGTKLKVVLALIAAAALVLATALVTTAMVRSESPYPGAQYVTALTVDDNSLWPASMGDQQVGSVRYTDFLGLTVFAMPQNDNGAVAGKYCLSIVTPDNLERDPAVGEVVSGCGVGPFPPTATVIVGGQSPLLLRDKYPRGAILHFAQSGDRVVVYSAAPLLT